MHEQIVRKITHNDAALDDSLTQTMDHFVEPSLHPQPSQLLPSFPTRKWSSTFSQHLAKRVRRNPRDLRAHVQRTLYHLSKHDSDAIYAALIDLFLILGKRGSHIRKNLFRQAIPYLSEEHYQFLSTRLKSGLDRNEPLPPNTFSSLSRGHSGTTQLVIRKSTDSNHSGASPLDHAMEQFNQNDWLTAMVILENALHHDPGDTDVTCELLSLYKEKHAREAFYRTYTALFGRRLAMPQLWVDTERFFSTQRD
jgi:hypothetical protein